MITIELTNERIAQIDACETDREVMSATSWGERAAYIKAKRGYRALSGFFQPTHNNINAKFRKVWAEETNH